MCESIKDGVELLEIVMAGTALSEVKRYFGKKRALVVVLLPRGICGVQRSQDTMRPASQLSKEECLDNRKPGIREGSTALFLLVLIIHTKH